MSWSTESCGHHRQAQLTIIRGHFRAEVSSPASLPGRVWGTFPLANGRVRDVSTSELETSSYVSRLPQVSISRRQGGV